MTDSVPGKSLLEESKFYENSLSENQSEINCDSCEEDVESRPAVGFCVECQSYLCDQCFQYHCLPRPMRHHRLLDKKEMPKKKVTGSLSEVCQKHEGETMKFYCKTHEEVGCNSCMVIEHKPCPEICSLADIAKGVEKSYQYRSLCDKITVTKRELEDQIRVAHENIEISKSCRETAICSIDEFQQKMLEKLESLRNEITKEAEEKERKETIKIEQVVKVANKTKEELQDLSTNMEILEETKQSKQLFVAIKKVEKQHQALVKNLEDMKKENKVERYSFVANELLSSMFQNIDALGELSIPEADNSSEALLSSYSYYLEYGFPKVLVTPDDYFLFTDRIFNDIYLMEDNEIIAKKRLTSCPWDVALTEENEFAVTFPNERKIKILAVADQEIIESREIKVNARCEGIAYANKLLLVACTNPPSVIVLDISGKIIRTISTDENGCLLFKQPAYIAFSRKRKRICVTDRQSDSINILTMEGKLDKVCKLEEVKMPLSIAFCEDSDEDEEKDEDEERDEDSDENEDTDEGKNENEENDEEKKEDTDEDKDEDGYLGLVDFKDNSLHVFNIHTGESKSEMLDLTDSDNPHFCKITDFKILHSKILTVTGFMTTKY
ncbi:uncharacterized protein LOC123536727 [Mercenaria mercenaria]|uniref:uncharacterized protein LOC123536727 n=1 Tax=Mercenaria mercenaria TaxID=6596 RepID=UPI00234F17F3|nr:uncharacterized protein LOC123536727 [Mercenaria mercenaria]